VRFGRHQGEARPRLAGAALRDGFRVSEASDLFDCSADAGLNIGASARQSAAEIFSLLIEVLRTATGYAIEIGE